MHSNQLRYFVSLAEKGSFTAGAAACGISQSAMSQQVKSLESELKARLTVRSGRGFALTPAGRTLYEQGTKLLRHENEVCEKVRRIASNTGSVLRLGLPHSIDFNDPEGRLANSVLNGTGFSLSVFRGNHDELYEKFTEGLLSAFISDESRLSSRSSYMRFSLFSVPVKAALLRRSPYASVIDTSKLASMRLMYVCDGIHLAEEEEILCAVTGSNLKIRAVSSFEEGCAAALSDRDSALIYNRSLLRKDGGAFDGLQTLTVCNASGKIRRPLCCYTGEQLDLQEAKELIRILRGLGCRKKERRRKTRPCEAAGRGRGRRGEEEMPPRRHSTGPAFRPDCLPL